MKYLDLRDFINKLESLEQLKRIKLPISPYLEITEISNRVLDSGGPALLFEKITRTNNHYSEKIPILTNLFGTLERVAYGMGGVDIKDLRTIGELLATLKEPEPPKSFSDIFKKMSELKSALWDMRPKVLNSGVCQEIVLEMDEVDLFQLPIQTCWPGDIAPLITWGLVITNNPSTKRQNLGIYRQQLLGKNKLIMRWLPHRGGALDFKEHTLLFKNQAFPIAVAIGADPATMLGAVTPIPDNLSEYQFAGLLRGSKTELTKAIGSSLLVPASAEIILEGHILPISDSRANIQKRENLSNKTDYSADNLSLNYENALEGPYGDHTGYYNEQEWFPVFTVDRITMRKNPIYHSTYTGKPIDEPAILGQALNEIFVPLLQRQLPEIVDFYLPPEGCSYRLAVVSIRKQYPGHAKRIMFGIWGMLRQFMYTKFIIVVDDDIDIRDWKQVIWAITTRTDPARDILITKNTPIDYLDFASPISGLGSKLGLDSTGKFPTETNRKWGSPIAMEKSVKERINAMWDQLKL